MAQYWAYKNNSFIECNSNQKNKEFVWLQEVFAKLVKSKEKITCVTSRQFCCAKSLN